MRKRRLGNAWPVRSRIYWCPHTNTPLLGRECSDGSQAFEVPLSEPGDARPASEYDVKSMFQGYKRETGSGSGFNDLVGVGVKLVNKVPFMDAMFEVVSEGVVIGKYYYDPLTLEWRFRFTQAGLLRVWDREPIPRYRLDGGLRELSKKRVHKNTINAAPLSQVAFVNANNEPIGVGYVSEDGEVIKAHNIFWEPQPPHPSQKVNSTWEDTIRENDYYIYYYKSRAIKFIHVMVEKVGKPVTVSFSGGKDSLVALHLTLEAGYKPVIIFNDTGIEMPETIKVVEEVAKRWGLSLLVASAGDSFWRTVERVGPPGKDYRWCCKVTKLAPLARLFREAFPEGAVNIVGQRAFESLDRARNPRVWRNKWLPMVLNISPIQEWNQLLVWLYIWKHKLPYNPLYDVGFDRIGCFMCPAGTLAEYNVVRESHPDLWGRWESFLRRWAVERLGLSDEQAKVWIERGIWRWLTNASQKVRLARRVGFKLPDWRDAYRSWLRPGILEFSLSDNGARVLFDQAIPTESLDDQYTVLGAFTRQRAGRYRLRSVEVELSGNEVVVRGLRGVAAREAAIDAVKLVYRWLHCAGCRHCETSCPTGAIRVVGEGQGYRPRVDPARCIHCKLCLDNCPVADVVAERVASALALNDVYAWRRAGRRTHESTVERYLKLHGFKLPEGAPTLDEDSLISPVAFEDPNGARES